MAFKLPFKLPTFDRRGSSPSQPPVMGGAPIQDRRAKRDSKLPLIGHLDI